MPGDAPWHGRATIAGRVAARVADRIIRGELGVGEVLTEVQIAADEGVSRTPVREAMLTLERWGLVRLMPKKGAVVTAASDREARDLLKVREMFEVSALAEVLTSDDARQALVADLGDSLAVQQQALDLGDLSSFSTADVAFHLRIIRANENQVVDELVADLGPRLARHIHAVLHDDGLDPHLLHQDHRAIAAHITLGDEAAACGAVRQHIERGLRRHRPEDPPAVGPAPGGGWVECSPEGAGPAGPARRTHEGAS